MVALLTIIYYLYTFNKMVEDKDLKDKLIGIYFRTSYIGFGENTPEDINFALHNTFQVFIDEETMNNGYSSDKENVKDLLFMYPYTLKTMDVGRSYSTLELEEFPGRQFNTVNFKFIKL